MVTAVVLVFAASVLTGVGATAATVSKGDDVRAMLLTLSDMPSGWTKTSSPTGGGSSLRTAGCLKMRPSRSRPVERAAVSFEGSQGLPALDESIAEYDHPIDHGFARVVRLLDDCRTLTLTINGEKVTYHIAEMPFAPYGDQSAAFQIRFVFEGISAAADLLVVRENDLALVLAEVNIPLPSLDQFEHFAKVATSKLTS